MTDDAPDAPGDEAPPLLVVHRVDNRLELLEHRLETLPEKAELVDLASARDALDTRRVLLAEQLHDLVREQRRLADEVATLEDRVAATEAVLSSLTSPKEAQAVAEELAGQRDRLDELETQALEQLESADPIEDTIAAVDGDIAELERRRDDTESRLAETSAQIRTEIESIASERAVATSEVDAGLLEDYTTRRATFGTSTVAVFDGTNCVGCPSAMPAVELDRMKHEAPGQVLDCSECGRMVIR